MAKAILSRMDKIEKILKSVIYDEGLQEQLEYLAGRWQDEKEYEDFNEYEKVLKPLVEKHGAKFVKATKAPFGFICEAENMKAHYTLTKEKYSFKLIGGVI